MPTRKSRSLRLCLRLRRVIPCLSLSLCHSLALLNTCLLCSAAAQEPEAEAEAEPEPEAEAEAEAETESEPEAEAEAEPEPEARGSTCPCGKGHVGNFDCRPTMTQTLTEVPEAEAEPEAEPETEPEAEDKPEAEPESEAEDEPEAPQLAQNVARANFMLFFKRPATTDDVVGSTAGIDGWAAMSYTDQQREQAWRDYVPRRVPNDDGPPPLSPLPRPPGSPTPRLPQAVTVLHASFTLALADAIDNRCPYLMVGVDGTWTQRQLATTRRAHVPPQTRKERDAAITQQAITASWIWQPGLGGDNGGRDTMKRRRCLRQDLEGIDPNNELAKLPDRDPVRQQLEALLEQVNTVPGSGADVRRSPPDGNCLFWSLGQTTTSGVPRNAVVLRERIVEHISRYRIQEMIVGQTFEAAIQQEADYGGSVDTYVAHMRWTPAVIPAHLWGRNIEIFGFCDCFQIAVEVYVEVPALEAGYSVGNWWKLVFKAGEQFADNRRPICSKCTLVHRQ